MKCFQCGSPKVQSSVEGKPYCSTHYRATREKLRNEAIIKLIPNIEKALADNPNILSKEDQEALSRLKGTYQVFKPKRSQGRTTKSKPSTIKDFVNQPEHGDEILAELIGTIDRDKLLGMLTQHLLTGKTKK